MRSDLFQAITPYSERKCRCFLSCTRFIVFATREKDLYLCFVLVQHSREASNKKTIALSKEFFFSHGSIFHTRVDSNQTKFQFTFLLGTVLPSVTNFRLLEPLATHFSKKLMNREHHK